MHECMPMLGDTQQAPLRRYNEITFEPIVFLAAFEHSVMRICLLYLLVYTGVIRLIRGML